VLTTLWLVLAGLLTIWIFFEWEATSRLDWMALLICDWQGPGKCPPDGRN